MNYMFMSMKNKLKGRKRNKSKECAFVHAMAFVTLLGMIFFGMAFPGIVMAQDNIDAYFEQGYEGSSNYYRTEPRTKKGLQEAFSYSGDFKDLGISHTLVNVCLNQLLNGNVAHVYNGKTYYFNYIPDLSTEAVTEFNQNDVCVTVVLLMQMDDASLRHNLIYPRARSDSKRLYYGWNVYDAGATETLSALMDFLASVYGRENCHIDNWIVGNEVNMPNAWNYTGTTSLDVNVDIAARSFLIVNHAIKRYNSGAKAYLSLDHSWTHNDEGRGIAGKTFLDAFAKRILELEPDIDWNLAYHPYASIMTDSNIWNSRNAYKYTPDSLSADFISAKNLNVLTDYVKNTYGEKVRIILSEQGFTVYNGQDAKQAAALAYTYYAAEFNDMVDATMFRALKDASAEVKDKFYFGLLNPDGSRRMSYDVFKYMDTEEWENYTAGCLNTMGISLWNEVVTYFDGERFVRKPLEELKLFKDGTVLATGYKETLEYTVYPEFASTKGLKWISNDENIVTVDANSGEMTGINPGRTVVMAACDGVEYATCIVVVKDAEEIRENTGKFIDELYMGVYGNTASEDDKTSYTDRLMTRNLTAAEVAYEVIARKEANAPSENEEAYVKMLYRALLGLSDEEMDAGRIEKYVECIQAGMSRDRVFADLVTLTEFDYRCYDFDVDTGTVNDIRKLNGLNLKSYNRDSDVTYSVIRIFYAMLDRKPEPEELKGLCSRLLSGQVKESDIVMTVYESEEFGARNLSNEELLDVLYEVTQTGKINEVARYMWLKLMQTGSVSRKDVVMEFSRMLVEEDKGKP